MPSFALIATLGAAARLEPSLVLLARAEGDWTLDVVIARHGPGEAAPPQAPPGRRGVHWLAPSFDSATEARAAAALASTAEWIAFVDASEAVEPLALERLAAFVRTPAAAALPLVWNGPHPRFASSARIVALDDEPDFPLAARLCFFRRELMVGQRAFVGPVGAGRRGEALLAVRVLARRGATHVGWLCDDSAPAAAAAAQDGADRPDAPCWSDPQTYREELQDGWLAALEEAGSPPPAWLQRWALADLRRFFSMDMRPKSPTMAVTLSMAEGFHDCVGRIVRSLDEVSIEAMPLQGASPEVSQALLSYRSPRRRTPVLLDRYDPVQGLARLTFHVHGPAPTEAFVVDGESVAPTYAKLRACRFFSRTLLHQRIVWLAVGQGRHLEVRLGGERVDVTLVPPPGAAVQSTAAASTLERRVALRDVRAAFPRGKGGQQPLPAGPTGWKVRLIRALARLGPVRRRFGGAWVFIDREGDADDNAEHFYRWVREHHPGTRLWFLLTRSSPDWTRLKQEGFRLVPPGLIRKLLILNSEQIVSSHAEYLYGGLERTLYGDCMQWRYSFLQHGVLKDDLSHWLGPLEFDLFTTSSPAEHASVVADATPYPYTDREVRRTGLPRHDRLLRIANRTPASDVDLLLVMPTWRAQLVDERTVAHRHADRLKAFAQSDYARQWRDVLRDPQLHEMAARHGKRVVFMPHPNAVPYLDAFEPPRHVEVFDPLRASVQQIFARSAGFVTDYTSVAFTMAFLRRQVFYYQPDREQFYSGGHNWRVGYFDYDRDGFGPVAFSHAELIAQMQRFLERDCAVEPAYLARMESAMPDRDDGACARVYESIVAMQQRVSRPFPAAARVEAVAAT